MQHVSEAPSSVVVQNHGSMTQDSPLGLTTLIITLCFMIDVRSRLVYNA